jgi:hypothetical protein
MTMNRSTDAQIVSSDGEARRVTVRLCRWDDPRPVSDGGAPYFEQFERGALTLDETGVHVLDQHGGDLIGRADADTLTDDGEGPTIELIMSNSQRATDMLGDIETGVINSVSMEFNPTEPPAGFVPAEGETVNRTAAIVSGVAFAFRPACSAEILSATREQKEGITIMSEAPTPAPVPEANYVTEEALERSAVAIRDDFERALMERADSAPVVVEHPAAKYRSLGEYTAAMTREGDTSVRAVTGLADQTFEGGLNAGVNPPGWLQEVQGIITQSRPVISSIGGGALPSAGMEVVWPYYDGDLTKLTGEQLAQKTSIKSDVVDIKKASTDIRTFAGGADMAYQLIRRSQPDFLSNWMRIIMSSWAVTTETVCATELESVAVASAGSAAGDLEAAAAGIFTASTEVEAATGSPATVLLAATDVFIALGSLGVATSTPYGVQNVAGHAAANTLNVTIAGLPLVHASALSAGTLIATNPSAASWLEDGPFTIAAEDLERLGHDVAVWSMGAFTPFNAAGVVSIATA